MTASASPAHAAMTSSSQPSRYPKMNPSGITPSITQPSGVMTEPRRAITRATTPPTIAAIRATETTVSASTPVRDPTSRVRVFVRPAEAVDVVSVRMVPEIVRLDRVLTRLADRSVARSPAAAGRSRSTR